MNRLDNDSLSELDHGRLLKWAHVANRLLDLLEIERGVFVEHIAAERRRNDLLQARLDQVMAENARITMEAECLRS